MAPTEPPFVTGSMRSTPSEGVSYRVVVYLHGEYDLANAARLTYTLARATAIGAADLVVDLSGVQFMDASTVGIILDARPLLRQESRSLIVRSPSSSARRLSPVRSPEIRSNSWRYSKPRWHTGGRSCSTCCPRA